MMSNKRVFNIVSVIDLIVIVYLFFNVDLFNSNLSRYANSNLCVYTCMHVFSLCYGFNVFYTLNRLGLNKLAYLGLFSLTIGLLIPYDYLDSNAFNSNLHLIFAYVSLCSLLLCFVVILRRIELIGFKYSRIIKFIFIVVCLINIYLYMEYMFVNTIAEILFIGVIGVSNIITINGI